jgi:hypothetical protein
MEPRAAFLDTTCSRAEVVFSEMEDTPRKRMRKFDEASPDYKSNLVIAHSFPPTARISKPKMQQRQSTRSQYKDPKGKSHPLALFPPTYENW